MTTDWRTGFKASIRSTKASPPVAGPHEHDGRGDVHGGEEEEGRGGEVQKVHDVHEEPMGKKKGLYNSCGMSRGLRQRRGVGGRREGDVHRPMSHHARFGNKC